jgi:hypothetical protein
LTKFALFTSLCALLFFSTFALAQSDVDHVDLAASGSTLYSFANKTSSLAFIPPIQRGGTYTGLSAAIVLKNHYGLFAEGAFRYHKGFYDGYQEYRPVFFDVNAMYSRHVAHKMLAEAMAGVGGESVVFYNIFAGCNSSACGAHVSADHFAFHAGGDLRYTFLRRLFVRPEIHYYLIPNNSEFRSNSVLRVGASIGYTFGNKVEKSPPPPPPPPSQ